ncbi:permease prefix domain 1-containing protein [Agrococcus sp. DT81.2]|uniref:permease prefix domain 1-containing protein n=1 Tax=Agrococcus sp. DT81.2 TaxID=3393414 RepID=UPI003CE5142B
MPTSDPVADLVVRLERAVVAPRGHRRDIVREIEGDLREAVAARTAAGVPEPVAASAVVAEFGEPAAIGAELSHELLADVGRRYSPVSAGLVGVLIVAWVAGMTTIAGLPGFRVPMDAAWMLPVSRALDVVAPLVAVAAAVGAIAIRRAGSMPALVAVASMQLALAAVLVGGAIALAVALPVPPAGAAIAVSLVALTVVLGSAVGVGAGALLLRFAAVRAAAATPARARARG